MPKLIMMSGPSGSGKSTLAHGLMEKDGNAVRVNRDKIREMSILKWTPKREQWIIDAEVAMVRAAALLGRNIIVDDTNLMPKDEMRWQQITSGLLGYTFEKMKVETDLMTCVARDAIRTGKEHIGRAAIERQFLRAKLWPAPEKDTVIFDIDGTLADLEHRVAWITIGADCPNPIHHGGRPFWGECPVCNNTGKVVKKQHDMFYSLVRDDEPIEAVVKWIQACYEHYHVMIVSGRSPETSEEGTLDWLDEQTISFDHILMRRAFMHGPDTEEKQLILDLILQVIPKEKIAFVVDDRPSVVQMWRDNGLRVFPVRGRDDDKFYEIMSKLEVTHPRPELEAQNEGQP